jgi:hypothetical protein
MHLYDDGPRIENIFLYIRKSTDENTNRQIRSLGDQRQECEALAERLSLNIVDVFQEEKSAKTPHKRPVFKRMLKELAYKSRERRRADGILAWHPNRLSRNAYESGVLVQMIDDKLIKDLFFPAYSFHNDASGIEHLTMELARAKGYSDHLSVSVLRGTSGREREGAMVYPVKFGYQKRREVPEKPELCSLYPIPCPTDFPIVQRIFSLRASGYSLSAIETFLGEEGYIPKQGRLIKSRIARIAADPFYFGKWYVNKGKDNERIIDFRKISLQDGTHFEPVITEAEFYACQSGQAKNQRAQKRIHRINPFANPVICSSCKHSMRPCWKWIKRAGGIREEQLGYECQTKLDDGSRCPQSRIKADILYEQIGDMLSSVVGTKQDFQRFLIGSQTFIKGRNDTLKRDRIRLSKAIKTHKAAKLDLLRQKAILSETGRFDLSDRTLIENEISNVGEKLADAETSYANAMKNGQSNILRFRKFIELTENLHGHWLSASLPQKRKITEKLLLNLEVQGANIRSQTWKEPFSTWLECRKFLCGRGEGTKLEPSFNALYKAIMANPVCFEDDG